jgi:hypothetical protein
MTPWELREYLYFLFSEAVPHPGLAALRSAGMQLEHSWQSLWACHGDQPQGWPEFRAALNRFVALLREAGPGLQMRNTTQLFTAMTGLTQAALADHGADVEARPQPTPAPAMARSANDARFERPVFIVSSPRSGSTLLFETLAKAPGVYTIGDESHALIEGIPELRPGTRQFSSNRLTAVDATPAIADLLRSRVEHELRDRSGAPPPAGRIRLLEKTPKNSLRVPFLARVFPEAHFIFLLRDVRETLASMIEAWQSGRFRTYPRLPAWTGLPWSMLLVPGWRDLIGKPLVEIVAKQWETTMRVLLDDLESLPKECWTAVRYDRFIADPQAEISRLCTTFGLDWDQALGSVLPEARYTLTAPAKEKWRRHESQIATVLPGLAATIERAERFAEVKPGVNPRLPHFAGLR